MQKFKQDKDSQSYSKTARILVLFVVAYMAQWWPLVVYTTWSYIAVPHIAIVEVQSASPHSNPSTKAIFITCIEEKFEQAEFE